MDTEYKQQLVDLHYLTHNLHGSLIGITVVLPVLCITRRTRAWRSKFKSNYSVTRCANENSQRARALFSSEPESVIYGASNPYGTDV